LTHPIPHGVGRQRRDLRAASAAADTVEHAEQPHTRTDQNAVLGMQVMTGGTNL
jgi:hypothetical protein